MRINPLIKNLLQRVYNAATQQRYEELVKEILISSALLSRIDSLLEPDEPPLASALQEWRRFYTNQKDHYNQILMELDPQSDAYTEWYRSGVWV